MSAWKMHRPHQRDLKQFRKALRLFFIAPVRVSTTQPRCRCLLPQLAPHSLQSRQVVNRDLSVMMLRIYDQLRRERTAALAPGARR